MLNEFFTNIKVPNFVADIFKRDDWYVQIGKFRQIIDDFVPKTTIYSEFKNVKIKGKVYIGKNVYIDDFVIIEGPAFIDDNVEIGGCSYIRPGSIISKGCTLGHASEIKNSLMMEESKISKYVYIGDSILGFKARMGGHSEATSRRFDQGKISFNFKGKELKTDLDKLGLILGEGSRLGGGVITYPGTMIGKNTFVSTMVAVQGFIPSNSYVKLKQELDIRENKFRSTLHNKSVSIEVKT